MKRLHFLTLLLISVCCIGNSYSTHKEPAQLFEGYLNLFEKKNIPFSIRFFYICNERPIIQDELKTFIPTELKNQYPNNTFSCLYLLPNNNDVIVALIFQDYMDEYENETLRLYIISYNTAGNIIDYQELAGYCSDGWEAYMSISKDYTIKQEFNNPIGFLNKEEQSGIRMEQTIYEYIIDTDGFFKEIRKTTRDGYWDFESSKFCPFTN